MKLRAYGFAALLLAAAPAVLPGSSGAGPAPDWLRRAAGAPISVDVSDAKAVYLLREQRVEFDPGGTVRRTLRAAVKVLTANGRSEAIAALPYLTDVDRVRELRGWVIRASGAVKELGGGDVLDLAIVNDDVYSEARVRSMDATSEVEAGAVFGYEGIIESRYIFWDYEWAFQDENPTVRSRFQVSAPADWTVNASVFNHAAIQYSGTGRERAWELTNLGLIKDEPIRPALDAIVPRLAVSVVPPPGAVKDVRAFNRWDHLAAWLHEKADPRADASPRLTRQAQGPAGVGRGEMERVRAIAEYVQAVHYISIQLGMGRGGGYIPRPASEVLQKSYGDCKDKSNLMRAMLRQINVPAHLVLVYYGDASHVREEWPAAQQFNHCIVAVRVADGVEGPVVDHPKLGRLLFFDPTDPATPLGDLPTSEQGSLGLLVTSEPGSLIRLPVLPADGSREERSNEVTLAADGSIHALVREHSTGQTGATARRLFLSLARPDYHERIESWVAAGVAGPSVARVEPVDSKERGAFDLTVEFTAPRYARALSGGLLLFRPALLDRWDWVALSAPERKFPVVLSGRMFRESSRFSLPEGYAVDELPAQVHLEAPFGTYVSRVEKMESGPAIQMTRELTLKAGTIPASDYPAVRSFFEKLRTAEQAMVVLAKR